METCKRCNGRGEVNWGEVPSIGGYVMETHPCQSCDGTGVHVGCRVCLDCGEIATEQHADGTWKLAGVFTVDGHTVTAPGFTPSQFTAFVARAKAQQLRTHPAGRAGVVMV